MWGEGIDRFIYYVRCSGRGEKGWGGGGEGGRTGAHIFARHTVAAAVQSHNGRLRRGDEALPQERLPKLPRRQRWLQHLFLFLFLILSTATFA